MTDTMTIAEEGRRLDDNQLDPPTNHYSQDELRRIQDAVKTYQRIKKELQRHREDWLKVVGPALVMVRDKAYKLSGTTKVTSQAYRDAIGGELKRTGLDIIDGAARSYLLKIMDNLESVEAWLATLTNTDRLNHPKTIWKIWTLFQERDNAKWLDDPGVDPEDAEEYWKAWEPEKTYCQCCGRVVAFVVAREDGSFFCSECHKANPEKDDHDAGGYDAGGDDGAGDHGAGDHDHDHDKGDEGKEVTALRKRISDLEAKLRDATTERERLYSENAELKLIIEGLQKQLSPATATADDEPIKIPRDQFRKMLRATGNKTEKMKLY
jgi:hypothetical protein